MGTRIKDYRRTFAKYLLVFIVPILVLASYFLYYQHFVQKEKTEDFQLSLFTQFSQEIDLFYSSLQDLALSMSREGPLPDEDATKAEEDAFLDILHRYDSQLDDNVLMLYYPRHSQKVYVDDQVMDWNDFEHSQLYDISLSVSGIYTRLCSVLTPYYLAIRPSGNAAGYSTAVFFPVPLTGTDITGTLCFLVRSDYFDEIYEQYFSMLDSQLLILTAYSDCIYMKEDWNDSIMEGVVDRVSRAPVGLAMYEGAGGEDYAVMKSRSIKTGFSYVIIADEAAFHADSRTSLTMLMVLTAVLGIFSVVISLLIAKNWYQTFFKEKQEQSRIQRALSLKTVQIKEMVIRKLVDGSIRDGDEKALEYNLKCANMSFHHPLFAVFLLDIPVNMKEDQVYTLQHRLNTTRDTDFSLAACQLEVRGVLLLLANYEESISRPMVAKAVSEAAKPFTGSVRIYAGGGVDSAFKVDNSYIEACFMKDRSPGDEAGMHFFMKEKLESKSFKYREQERSIIMQAVRNGSLDAALGALDELFIIIDETPSPNMVKGMSYELINTIGKLCVEVREDVDEGLIDRLMTFRDPAQLHEWLEELVRQLVEEITKKGAEEDERTRHELVSYVQEHFADRDLSLDKLSSIFKLSFSSINKIFREETDTTFKSYTTELRFSQVKKELRETDRPIKDIITDCGYMDVANYLRKFKQHEGITPGQYRAQHRGGD